MRALQFTEYEGPEVLRWADAPVPHAGPGPSQAATPWSSPRLPYRPCAASTLLQRGKSSPPSGLVAGTVTGVTDPSCDSLGLVMSSTPAPARKFGEDRR
jgi:hypothetical protein